MIDPPGLTIGSGRRSGAGKSLDVIEKAIRGAFAKGNPGDRAFREKVYRSAFAALDRALLGSEKVTVETAMQRRKNLQAKITEIESEYLPAMRSPPMPGQGPDPVVPAVELGNAPAAELGPEAPPVGVAHVGSEPAHPADDDGLVGNIRPRRAPMTATGMAVDREDRVSGVVAGFDPDISLEEPHGSTGLAGDRGLLIDPPERRPIRRRRPYAYAFILATLLAAIGMGGWWAYRTGLLQTPAERDTAVPNPPQTVTEEDFVPENEAAAIGPAQSEAGRDWITVFSPNDATQVSAPTDASAEVVEGEAGKALRIRSGASGSAVVFDVGQGILEQVAGKRAIFEIIARSGDESGSTEMSVDCNFGELGGCDRKRYAVGRERAEYLFEVDFPQINPGAGGTIAINSDFAKQGKSADIFEIRVSVVP